MPSFEVPLPYRPDRSKVWPQSFYNLRVDGLPLIPQSTQYVTESFQFHQTLPVNPHTHVAFGPFGQNNWNEGGQAAMFVDRLPAGTSVAFNSPARVNWTILQPPANHPGKHLYFADLRQEGAVKQIFNPFSANWQKYDPLPVFVQNDKHSIMWSPDSGELVETILYRGDRPECGHAVTFITNDYEMPLGTDPGWKAGVNASRIPIAPLFFTWQDLVDCGTTGDLGHMIGIVMEDGRNPSVWPARGNDFTRSTGIPQGSIVRLRADFDESVFPRAEMRALARTLKRHGGVVYDRAPVFAIGAPSDPQWPVDVLTGQAWGTRVQITDLEIVDVSSVKVDSFTRRYPLEPPAGTIRVGLSRDGHLPGQSVETKHEDPTGMPIGMHRRFKSWASRMDVTSELEVASLAGRSVHISFKTPNWAAVANGNHDAELNTLFAAIRDTSVCCWVSFQHEPENDLGAGLGTAADWQRMQIRINQRRIAVGATNCVVVPILMSYTWNSASGRNPNDWINLLSSTTFPLFGIDFYSNVYATSPTNLRNNTEFNNCVNDLVARGYDITFPELGGAIGTTNTRPAALWEAMVAEALDPANRIKALCWFDMEPGGTLSGINRLGGPADPTGALLAAFQTSLTATYSYRGGAWRGSPTGVIDSIRVTDTTPDVVVPPTGSQTVYRKVTGTWQPQTIKRRVGGQWVNQTIKRITE